MTKGVDLHMDGRDMALPIFWEDRIVPTNIWANLFALSLEWTDTHTHQRFGYEQLHNEMKNSQFKSLYPEYTV